MKDLLSEEHYCYKIHTLLMESNDNPLSIDKSLIWTTPIFTRKSWLTPHPLSLLWFFKIPNLLISRGEGGRGDGGGGCSHYLHYDHNMFEFLIVISREHISNNSIIQ